MNDTQQEGRKAKIQILWAVRSVYTFLRADCFVDKVIVKVSAVNDEKAKSLQRVYDAVGNFFCAAVFCWKPKHDMNLKMCKCHNCFGGETNLSLHYSLKATHFAMKLSANSCLAENFELAVVTIETTSIKKVPTQPSAHPVAYYT